MVTFTLTPPTPRVPTSLRQVVGPADITFECGGQRFKAHQHIVCPQSQKLQDACDRAAKEGVPVVINEDAFDLPTTKRLLDFLYHGEYDVGTAQQGVIGDDDNKVTTYGVLSHVCCYAIGQDHQVEGLSTQALKNFSEDLSVVSPDDFAELMGTVAAHIEATPVHGALLNAASRRQDELAACKKFMKVLGCGHIAESASQDCSGVSDLRAAKQLAVHGAKLFRTANHSTTVANIEKAKLVKAYQGALKQIDQLRSQVDKDSSTLFQDELVHNDAKDAILASEAAAKQAKDKLLASEERASRMTQAMQKMRLELEVLRNAEHNNKVALEKANKEAPLPRLTLEESLGNSNGEVITLRASLEAILEANRRYIANEQRLDAEIQRLTKGQEKTAAELAKVKAQRDNAVTNNQGASRGTQRVKDQFFASQKKLARVKQERDEAETSLEKARQDHDCTSASLFLITSELARAERERDQARAERDRARDQATTQQGTAAQMLEKANQEFANKFNQVVAENTALEKAKEERDQATGEQKRTASNLKKAVQESDRLRSERNEVRTENTALRTQASNDHTTMSEGARMLTASTQQNEAMAQHATETASLRAEVNQVRLQNFTLQRSIYDLQLIILDNAENRQQLLEYGGLNFPTQ